MKKERGITHRLDGWAMCQLSYAARYESASQITNRKNGRRV